MVSQNNDFFVNDYTIKHTRTIKLSKWVRVNEKNVLLNDGKFSEVYHSIFTPDYVNVVGVTTDGYIPLVRQYRPALENFTLELPGGLLEENDTPESTAKQELLEETGFVATKSMLPVLKAFTDTGRIENEIYGFFGCLPDSNNRTPQIEPGIECILTSRRELKEIIMNNKLSNALHVGIVLSAVMKIFAFLIVSSVNN